ncbi:MAG: hypothetical protein WC998_09225 [Candidatus Paceibacterota bacterium]|jgi:hypothetical protein
MSVWKVGKNERFHNKKVYIQYTDAGVCTGLMIEFDSSVCPRKNETWIQNPKGLGMMRTNPIIRHCAYRVLHANCHNTPDIYDALFVSWTEIPNVNDFSYSRYIEDTKRSGYLGIQKSISAVKTATKKYMLEY